jgi:DNA polymerase-3 subunit beta
MKLTILKNTLLQALQQVEAGTPGRSSFAILNNVLIEAKANSLQLTTTDMELAISCTVEAQVETAGITTLPVRHFFNIVRDMPDGNLSIETNDKHQTTIVNNSVRFKIAGIPPDDFPKFSSIDAKSSFKLPQRELREMFKKVSYAASTEESRYILNGVLMNFKRDKLVVVATDGKRLALVETEIEVPKDQETNLIIPQRTVNLLIRTLKDEENKEVKLSADSKHIQAEFDGITLYSKLIEGTYPNYRQVIPSHCDYRIAVDRENFIEVLQRVSLIITERTSAVTLKFMKNKLIVTASTEIGEAEETITVKYDGKEMSITFNPVFLLEPLKNLTSDEVYLELTDDVSPGVIKADIPFVYVLMPIRVR